MRHKSIAGNHISCRITRPCSGSSKQACWCSSSPRCLTCTTCHPHMASHRDFHRSTQVCTCNGGDAVHHCLLAQLSACHLIHLSVAVRCTASFQPCSMRQFGMCGILALLPAVTAGGKPGWYGPGPGMIAPPGIRPPLSPGTGIMAPPGMRPPPSPGSTTDIAAIAQVCDVHRDGCMVHGMGM